MLDCWLHIHVGYWRTDWSEALTIAHANLFFELPEYWFIIRLVLSDDFKQIVTLPWPSIIILINSGRLARELSGFKSNWPSQHDLSYMFTIGVKHQLYKQIKGGVPVPLFPWNKLACSPVHQKSEICPIVSLLLFHWYPGSGVALDCIDSWSLSSFVLFLCSLFPTIVFVPLWPSKLGLCSPLPLK